MPPTTTATASSQPPRLGFIGGGMMAEAIINGILKANLYSERDIIVSDPSVYRLNFLDDEYGVKTTKSNIEVYDVSDIIIVAVKPQYFQSVVENLICNVSVADDAKPKKLFVSIMAGVKLTTLREKLGVLGDFVRVMPNTPATVGAAASVYTCSRPFTNDANESFVAFVGKIFESIGTCQLLDSETLLDAVTGLSGSGPAYVFTFIEALSDGGVKNGLPRALAMQLAAQTVYGAAKMLLETEDTHPAVLKNQVESPGGTTIAGTSTLEEGGFRSTVIQAVTNATQRSKDLGRPTQDFL